MSASSLTESESSGLCSSISSFRLSVCLQNYFSDIRSQCYILITRKRRMKTIKWLEKRIKKIFQISGRFHLKTKEHFLPSSERLALLNPDDRVEVIPQKMHNEKHQSNENNSYIITGISNNDHNKLIGEDIPDTNIRQNTQLSSNDIVRTTEHIEIHKQNLAHEQIFEIRHPKQSESNCLSDQNLQFNCPKEVQDDSQALEQLKKRALTILDENYDRGKDKNESTDTFNSTCIPRKRRRVRRRPRRANDLGSQIKSMNENVSTNETIKPVSPECFDIISLNNAEKEYPETLFIGPKEIYRNDSDGSSTISGIVTRNESIYVRKPRIVQSLNEITS